MINARRIRKTTVKLYSVLRVYYIESIIKSNCIAKNIFNSIILKLWFKSVNNSSIIFKKNKISKYFIVPFMKIKILMILHINDVIIMCKIVKSDKLC